MTDTPLVRDEPERLLSLGEVADLLGVADMELRRLVRTGALATSAGWRRGRLTRLVRAGDLLSVDASVGARPLPGAVPSELAHGLEPEEPQRLDVPAQPDPVEEETLGDELDALKADLEATRAHNEQLLRQLETSDEEVQGLFHDLGREELRTRKELKRQHRDQEEAERILVQLRRLQIGAGILLIASLVIVARMAWSVDEGNRVFAGDSNDQREAAVEPTGAKEQPVFRDGPTLDAAPEPIAEEVDPPAPVTEPASAVIPLGPVAGLSEEPALLEEAAVAADPAPTPEPEAGPAPGEVLETLDPGIAGADDPPCGYFELTRPGAELRELLGPCSGRWSETHGAVAAAVRTGGVGLCRHHHFFSTRLGGSLDRAKEVAELAAAEGLIAPLLELRVDRAGAEFLRRRAGEWIESGFEAGLVTGAEPHELEPVPDQADTWQVRSWVRYLDVGGVEHRRRFSMTVELGDGPAGDRLLAFDWVDPVR